MISVANKLRKIANDITFNDDPVYKIKVDRLLKVCNPFSAIGIPKNLDLSNVRKQKKFKSDVSNRTKFYHLGRIKYLINLLKNNKRIDPIVIHSNNYGSVYVADGNHRIIAAYLAKNKYIDAHFSGNIKLLDWLTGKIDAM